MHSAPMDFAFFVFEVLALSTMVLHGEGSRDSMITLHGKGSQTNESKVDECGVEWSETFAESNWLPKPSFFVIQQDKCAIRGNDDLCYTPEPAPCGMSVPISKNTVAPSWQKYVSEMDNICVVCEKVCRPWVSCPVRSQRFLFFKPKIVHGCDQRCNKLVGYISHYPGWALGAVFRATQDQMSNAYKARFKRFEAANQLSHPALSETCHANCYQEVLEGQQEGSNEMSINNAVQDFGEEFAESITAMLTLFESGTNSSVWPKIDIQKCAKIFGTEACEVVFV